VFGEIVGWEALLVLAVIVLLFGGSRLPKLARSLGSAKAEFEKGLHDGPSDEQPPENDVST
jgi:sec-independent protein translocase protein TatA